MKRIALACAAIALIACTTESETPAADTAAPAVAPSPAPADTMGTDTMQADSARDTTATP
jgi:hypothetical protein